MSFKLLCSGDYMVLPVSGAPLSLSQMKVEFGTGAVSLSSYYRDSLTMCNYPNVSNIGQMLSLSQFFGRSKQTPPTNFSANPTMTGATLTWTAPSNPVTSYVLSITPAHGTVSTILPTDTSCLVTGLTNNAAYSASLTATIGTYVCAPTSTAFVTMVVPSKYSWFTASNIATYLPLNGNITTWKDQSGFLRDLTNVAGNPTYPTFNMNGSLPVVRVLGGGSGPGFKDSLGKRIMPLNSAYTKMLVFIHNNAADLMIPNWMSYFSTFSGAVGGMSVMSRLNGGTFYGSSTGLSSRECGTTFTPVHQVWYALFMAVDTNRVCNIYVNESGVAVLKGTGTLSSLLTTDNNNGLISWAEGSYSQTCDVLEAATWNTFLTSAQATSEISRLKNKYGVTL
jgi:Fibronectin type III domain